MLANISQFWCGHVFIEIINNFQVMGFFGVSASNTSCGVQCLPPILCIFSLKTNNKNIPATIWKSYCLQIGCRSVGGLFCFSPGAAESVGLLWGSLVPCLQAQRCRQGTRQAHQSAVSSCQHSCGDCGTLCVLTGDRLFSH